MSDAVETPASSGGRGVAMRQARVPRCLGACLAAVLPGSMPPVGLWQAIEARLGGGTGSSDAEWL